MKRITLIFALLVAAIATPAAVAQGVLMQLPPVVNSQGQPIAGVTVSVFQASGTLPNITCGTPVTVYKDQALTQPFTTLTTDGFGNFPFWILPQLNAYGYTVSGQNTSGTACYAFSATALNNIQVSGDVCTNLVTAMTNNPTGPEFTIPAGSFTCSQPSYTLPNNGQSPPNQVSFRIRGATADAGTNSVVTFGKVPVTGTIITFTGTTPGSGCRINTLGQGQLEISGITFVETNTSSPCGILVTNTVFRAHENYFYGPTFALITTTATRIQTTGGTSALKYQLDLGASNNGTLYNYIVYVKNSGSTAVTVGGAFAGSTITVAAGSTQMLGAVATGDGTTHIQLNFSTANVGDAMNVVAYFPRIGTGAGFNTNLVTGANTTFQNGGGGTWAAQNGAAPTITQNITIDQEPAWDALVMGGGTGNDDGTLTAGFQGYGTVIENNVFNQVRSAVVGKSFFNAGNIFKNTVWSNSGSTTQGAIDLSSSVGAVYVHANLIEAGYYKFPFWNHASSTGNIFTGNSCFDTTSLPGAPFLQCFRFESGSANNVVIHSNGDAMTGGLNGSGGLISEAAPGTNKVLSTYGNQGLGYTLLSDTTLGSPAANITISSIPGTYNHLVIDFQGRGDAGSNFIDIGAQFNGDSGANYDVQLLSAINVTAGAAVANAATSCTTVTMPGSTVSRANLAGSGVIELENYAGTTFEKQAISHSGQADSTAANMSFINRACSWRNTAAITSIKLIPGSGNFVAGTRVTLYGKN